MPPNMKLSTALIGFAVSFSAFVFCYLVMYWHGPELDTPIVVYPLGAVAGLSCLLWPVFFILSVRRIVGVICTRCWEMIRAGRRFP